MHDWNEIQSFWSIIISVLCLDKRTAGADFSNTDLYERGHTMVTKWRDFVQIYSIEEDKWLQNVSILSWTEKRDMFQEKKRKSDQKPFHKSVLLKWELWLLTACARCMHSCNELNTGIDWRFCVIFLGSIVREEGIIVKPS